MKVKVLIKFKDKYTGEIHKKDKVFDVTEERYHEILEKGELVKAIEELEAPEVASAEEPEAVAPAQPKVKKKNKKDVE